MGVPNGRQVIRCWVDCDKALCHKASGFDSRRTHLSVIVTRMTWWC